LAWYYLQFDVPQSWEVIKYRKNPVDGQLVLSDRYGETMQVFWKKMNEKPVVARRLTELIKTNLEGETTDSVLSRIEVQENWRIYRHDSRRFPSFAGMFLEEEKILLLVMIAPHKRHDPRRIIDKILATYKPNNGDERCWALAGLQVTLPKEYVLDQIQLVPAAQRISFETKKGYTAVVSRFGMRSVYLSQQSLESFIGNMKGKDTRLLLKNQLKKDDQYPAVELRYYTKGTGSILTSLLARKWVGQIFAWESIDHERIYTIENHAREGRGISDLMDRMKTL